MSQPIKNLFEFRLYDIMSANQQQYTVYSDTVPNALIKLKRTGIDVKNVCLREIIEVLTKETN